MGSVSDHAYLDTRVSLFASRLLQDRDIERLIEAADPDGHPPSWLGEAIGLDSEGIAGIDRSLMPRVLSELSILLRALYREDRALLRYWATRFELANLKTLLRGKMTGRSYDTLRAELVHLGGFCRVSLESLLLSSDTAELLRQLEQSPYAEFAREMRRGLNQRQELFTIDAAVDRHYFGGLAARARNVGRDAHVLVGSMIDRVNLVWLLRYRFSYELPPAQAYYLLIPTGYRLSHETLIELTRLDSLERVLEALPPPFHQMLQGARSASEVTRRLEYHTWETALRILRGRRFNPTRALAYMILRERDLRRVRAVLRGQRLSMDPLLIRVATGLANADGAASGSATREVA
jgi:V/A-type H+-transporting ATPase subunit C